MTWRAIYYDTETTGVKSDRDRIIEIAAYDPVQDRRFVSLVNPGMAIPAEATAIHHITYEMVQSAPSFGEVALQFTAFCEGDTVLVAHNNDSFDLLFLKAEFARAGVEFPKWRFIDSLKWARRYRKDLPRHTLQHLRETYGIASNNAHRAMDDVIVLQQVFSKMIDDLPLETVYGLLSKPMNVATMPFGKHQGLPLSLVPRDYVAWLEKSGSFDKPDNKELKTAFEKAGLLGAGSKDKPPQGGQ